MENATMVSIFNEIVSRRNELSLLTYSDEKYDDLEDELHDLEDDFNEEYGEMVEDLLMDVQDDLKVDMEVLLPTAYFLPKYVEEGNSYDLGPEEGVAIELEEMPDCNARLMLLPDPMRVAFAVEGAITKEWEIK